MHTGWQTYMTYQKYKYTFLKDTFKNLILAQQSEGPRVALLS